VSCIGYIILSPIGGKKMSESKKHKKHNHECDAHCECHSVKHHHHPQVSIGKIVTKVPVVLAELTLQANIDTTIVFPEPVLEIKDIKKPQVGLVGEILVKFHPTANNNIVDILEAEGAEAVMPDLMDFFLYCAFNHEFKNIYLSGSKKAKIAGFTVIKIIEYYRSEMKIALNKSNRFEAPKSIECLAENASKILSIGNQTGEGWFLTAEMIELIEEGAPNILCMQPFACLPNHVTGKGMIKVLKNKYPKANIVAVDYDPGASEVNQLNRIKLMLAVAFKNLQGDAKYDNTFTNDRKIENIVQGS